MKDRVLKNYVTTLIGLLVAIFAMLAFWFGKVNMETFFVILAAGCTAIGMKDTVFNRKP
jgi:hypothetical protein